MIEVKDDPEAEYSPGGKDDARVITMIHIDLVDAYILGDYIQDEAFRNAVVDEMQRAINERSKMFNVNTTSYLWNNVQHDSKLGRMIVDYCAADFRPEAFVRNVELYPQSFVIEIAKISVLESDMSRVERKPRNRPKCYYHDHEKEHGKCQ